LFCFFLYFASPFSAENAEAEGFEAGRHYCLSLLTFRILLMYHYSMEHNTPTTTLLMIMDRLKSFDLERLSERTGARIYEAGGGRYKLEVRLFDDSIWVTYPDIEVRDSENGSVSENLKGLVLYYLITADGTSLYHRWVALSELTDGAFYNQAYQGYTGNRLVKTFGNDLEAFRSASLALVGSSESYGDIGFSFQALPKVPVLAVYWKGDEEFSPSAKVLFDGSASHYLPTDLCAYLGSVLTEKLIEGSKG
jgi:hypothetical protein